MKSRLFIACLLAATAAAQAQNPIISGQFTADPTARVFEGKVYLYPSHDIPSPIERLKEWFCMADYHVFSSDNLTDWTDHGVALSQEDVPWGDPNSYSMWAPDCVYKDGTYYFYFPHPTANENWNSTWRIGVAISKYPDKEFWVVGYVEGMPAHIDPCVFVDDDGQPYIYNGGGGECFGGKLNKNNWTRLDGDVQKMIGLEDFHEGAWVHKKD